MTPLVPANVDLRDFQFMPLDCLRLRDSDLAAICSGDEFRAAVLLWCASWHQLPAASLPDDDAVLSQLAGYGRVVKEWKKVRSGAMRGWIKCDDGRFYHPVVAEKANEAWGAKLGQRWRTECARIKKHAQRQGIPYTLPTFEEWASLDCPQGQQANVPRDNHSLSLDCPQGNPVQGTGTGTGIVIKELPTTSGESPPIDELKIEPDPIFGTGLALLTRKGVAEKSARSFLGLLRKKIGDLSATELLVKAETEDISDPIPWLRKAAESRQANHARGSPQTLQQSKTAGAISILENMKYGTKTNACGTLVSEFDSGGAAKIALPGS